MINADFIKRNGRYVGFSVEGHADYGEYGYDIVCSAVSAVVQTILMGIIDEVGQEAVYKVSEEAGVHCSLTETKDIKKLNEASLLISVLNRGLCSIEREYREYLRVTEREEN